MLLSDTTVATVKEKIWIESSRIGERGKRSGVNQMTGEFFLYNPVVCASFGEGADPIPTAHHISSIRSANNWEK
jgi:hypothetical protein